MIDFLTFINNELTTWSASKKQALRDDFVYAHGYQDEVDDGNGGTIPNPVTKNEFFNLMVRNYFKNTVESYRRQQATIESADLPI